MATVMDWIFSMFGTKVVTQTTVEEKTEEKVEPKELDFKSLEEQVAKMSKSGCGCSRGSARDLFAKYSVGTPEETVIAYNILRDELHSYCRVTGGSFTGNNIGTVRTALEAMYTALENGTPETRDGLMLSLGGITSDLSEDYGRNIVFTNKDVQRLASLASKFLREKDYATAIEVLTKAKFVARNSENKNLAVEMVNGLLTTYRPTVIAGLSKEGRTKVQDLRMVIDWTTQGELRSKMWERLDEINAVQATYADRFPKQLEEYYMNKISLNLVQIGEHDRQYENKKRELTQKVTENGQECDKRVGYLRQTQNGTKDEALRGDLDTMIAAKVAEKVAYQTSMQERLSEVGVERDTAIQPLQEQVDALKHSLDSAVEHYNAGTMTRAEYKAVEHEMREYNRDMKKKQSEK